MPKVSIIVPIYNPNKIFLKKCLGSILSQTLEDIEIICVNDGSTDDTLTILEEYKNNDSRIIVLDQKNQGQGSARQNGIEAASGEYIGFVDSDDYIDSTMYEKLYNQAKNLNSDIVECDYNAILDWDKKNIKDYNLLQYYNEALSVMTIEENKNYHWKEFKDIIFKRYSLMLWNKIFKTKLIREKNIKSQSVRHLGEDTLFVIDATINSKKIAFIREGLYFYVIHPLSAVRQMSILTSLEMFRNSLYKILTQNVLFEDMTLKNGVDDHIRRY